MSNSERHFLTDPAADLAQWVIARYWYYPDSVGVESDEDDRLAAVTRTQLTADVERVSAGAGAAQGKKPALPAVFRENIRGSEQELRPLRRGLPRISRPLLRGPAHGPGRLARPGAAGSGSISTACSR